MLMLCIAVFISLAFQIFLLCIPSSGADYFDSSLILLSRAINLAVNGHRY
jgi:hypothetical protein